MDHPPTHTHWVPPDPQIDRPPMGATSWVVPGTDLHLQKATIANAIVTEQALPLNKPNWATKMFKLHLVMLCDV